MTRFFLYKMHDFDENPVGNSVGVIEDLGCAGVVSGQYQFFCNTRRAKKQQTQHADKACQHSLELRGGFNP
jgi:hypothetical protein